MPFQSIDNPKTSYGLISFDAQGKEQAEADGKLMSDVLLAKAKTEQPTNIFLFSHGWKGDIPAAVDQYDRWIGAMAKLTADADRLKAKQGGNFQPLYIGLHWPSQPWGDEALPQNEISFAAMAGEGAAVSPAGVAAGNKLELAVQHFGGSDAVRGPLQVIFAAHEADPMMLTLDDKVKGAYQDLAKAIGFKAGTGDAPDEDGAALDPQEASRVQKKALKTAASFSGGGGPSFEPVLSGLRQLSFWTMKRRARSIGETGMHQFVKRLLQETTAKVHLMGHSFGCVVVSSIMGGPDGQAKLPRPIASAALVQGAVSLWSYADDIPLTPFWKKPGYFRSVLKGNVAGPIVTTRSRHDRAVGVFYPAAVMLKAEIAFDASTDAKPSSTPPFGGMGTYGIQGASNAEHLFMKAADSDYNFQAGRIYNLESSAFISKGGGASGAHSDIDGPEVAHAIWQAALAS